MSASGRSLIKKTLKESDKNKILAKAQSDTQKNRLAQEQKIEKLLKQEYETAQNILQILRKHKILTQPISVNNLSLRFKCLYEMINRPLYPEHFCRRFREIVKSPNLLTYENVEAKSASDYNVYMCAYCHYILLHFKLKLEQYEKEHKPVPKDSAESKIVFSQKSQNYYQFYIDKANIVIHYLRKIIFYFENNTQNTSMSSTLFKPNSPLETIAENPPALDILQSIMRILL